MTMTMIPQELPLQRTHSILHTACLGGHPTDTGHFRFDPGASPKRRARIASASAVHGANAAATNRPVRPLDPSQFGPRCERQPSNDYESFQIASEFRPNEPRWRL